METALVVPASCRAEGLPPVVNIETSMSSDVTVPLSFMLVCNMDDSVILTVSSSQSDEGGFYLIHKSGDMLRYGLTVGNNLVLPLQQITITPNQTYPTVLSFPAVSMKNYAGNYTGVVNFNFTY